MKYIAFIEIPKANMDEYLKIRKSSIPEGIKIILPPQVLGMTKYNFSGLVIFEPKDLGNLFSFLEEYKSAGFKISLSPIWENEKIIKKLDEYREAKQIAEAMQKTESLEKLDIGYTSSLEIIPLVDWKTSIQDTMVEPGVSYLIKTDEINILFDVGLNIEQEHPSPLLNNMERMGVSLKDIDAIVISHNHADHVGGGEWAEDETFSLTKTQIDLGDIKVFTPVLMTYPGLEPYHSYDPTSIGKGVTTIGVISNPLFFGGWTPEQAIAVNVEDKGIVLIIGCGHQTLPRLLHRTEAIFSEPLYGLVGGLHFPVEGGPINFFGYFPHQIFGTGKEPWNPITKAELQDNITLLQQYNLQLIALSPHDSSETSMEIMRENFPTTFREIRIGDPIRISSGQ